MKITNKVLCIPPYISTTWDKVICLKTHRHAEDKQLDLMIHLEGDITISIPHLDASIIDLIFAAHTRFLETKSKPRPGILPLGDIGALRMDNIEMLMQHNPAQVNAPDLPPEVLEKIAQITHIMIGDDKDQIPKPEPHCNCMYCQLARALHGSDKNTEEEDLDSIDLNFCSWIVHEIGHNLYSVQNKLDEREQYNVYLGSPIGCTCGHKDCEHIKTVLET